MSFMSGMVDGFMDTAGAGDAGGAADATSGASSISSDSSDVGTNMVDQSAAQPKASGGGGIGGMMGGGGSSSKAAPAPSGGGAAGQVSPDTNLTGSSTNQNSTMQQMGKMAKSLGSSMSQPKAAPNTGNVVLPGNSYSAIFGTQTVVPEYGGGRIGVQQSSPMAAPPMPSPAPIPQAPMAPPPPPPAPAPMPMQSVSDVRAKYKIQSKQKARSELDGFLQNVYNNVISKRKS